MSRLTLALLASTLSFVAADVCALSKKVAKRHEFKTEASSTLAKNQKDVLSSSVRELKASCFESAIEVVVVEETTASKNSSNPTKSTSLIAEYLVSLGIPKARIFEGETISPEIGLVKVELVCTPAQ